MSMVLCRDADDAKHFGDAIGWIHVTDWEFKANGKVAMFIDCEIEDITV